MATCTLVKSTAVTTNSSAYTQVVTGATVGNLIVALVGGSATVGAGTSTDNKGGTYSVASSVVKNSSGDTAYAYIANQFVTTSSFTINFGFTGDPSGGAVIGIYEVSGMTLTGLTARRQNAVQNNGVASSTPVVTFGAAVSSSNPTIGAVFNGTNPAGLTPPTSWTESTDLGYATPTNGGEFVFRNDTFNGTTVTWGGTSASAFSALMIELDTSTGAAAGGAFPPRRTLLGVGR